MVGSRIKNKLAKGLKWSNWAGNVTCYAEQILYPETEAQIVEIVQTAALAGKKNSACRRRAFLF
jgi:hypothetical protein